MDLFAGIDGTGPISNPTYAAQFAHSFVNRLHSRGGWGKSYYLRGPNMDGQDTRQLSRMILREVEGDLHRTSARKVSRVFLAGYSRGGAAVIRVCRELAQHGHVVDGLILFDAVDRSLTVAADRIPSNVRNCYHARRHPSALSRNWWHNCGNGPENGARTNYVQEYFLCTHGAMGGMPWLTADTDGKINEAMTDRTVSGRLLQAGPLSLPFVIANEAHRLASKTNITIEEDRKASARVFVAANTFLTSLRAARVAAA
ncbi:hypothetical protein [Aureimonas sp. ME7]|uniref:hypothetical protein n=1 Tax=Aureimonas sp. ME7 TaxID=2744252 RepID=UPI0015F5172F|nr:hypothetical protein [Aureimonas sp. ME7]